MKYIKKTKDITAMGEKLLDIKARQKCSNMSMQQVLSELRNPTKDKEDVLEGVLDKFPDMKKKIILQIERA